MGEGQKPLRADARRNRERVLRIAQAALASDGLAISFDEIARRAGFGVGTVYRHFPTKEALFEAVLLDRIERLVADARALALADDPVEAFLGFFAAAVGQVATNQALRDALGNSTGLGFKASTTLEDDFNDALGRLLRRAQQAGAIRDDLDAADVKDLLIGTVTAERRAHDRAPDRADGRATSGRLTSTVCDGMRTHPR
ncbi:helix-turn-helix domain-containing protein [Nonomuraea sp. NPDC000554]|uniref:TetR/AcrR family transcriptional regulator n=1 Tax=Nonomuraea sp. NPDC000554 TaxID=3154259 RepID=UPI003319B522